MSYDIMVGRERPATAVAGHLEKVIDRNPDSGITWGNHRIKGESKEAAIKVGVYGIPNHTIAWGRRVVNGKPKIVDGEEMGYEVDEPQYKGEIEFLKWEDIKGQAIDCRWVRNVMSLDVSYQDLILKVKFQEQDISSVILQFKQGENRFNEIADKSLIQFLKIHYYNEQSISKSPTAESKITFKEIRKEEQRKKKASSIDNKIEGALLVKKVSEGVNANQQIKNLFSILNGIEFANIDKEKVDDIYEALLVFADEKPNDFAQRILNYKKNISNAITKAETYEKLDLTKDGIIAYLDKGKSKPIIEGIAAKGDNMKQWCFENYYLPNVFEGLDKLKKLVDKL